MDILQVLILSIVEGVTEYLPISSTGHLVLTANALRIPQTDFVKSFEIIIQLGAILAVIVLYWKSLLSGFKMWKTLFLAFLPSAIIGFTLYPVIKDVLLGNPLITVIALFVGGVILIILEKIYTEKNHHTDHVEDITTKQALLIGCAQAISVIPGVSRAGATIMGGLFAGAKRTTAVEFSFLLAVPTMLSASALDLYESKLAFSQNEWGLIAFGFIASFFVALLAIKTFLKFIKTNTFVWFGVYRIVFSLIYFLIFLL